MAVAGVCILGIMAAVGGWYAERSRVHGLESRVAELQQKERRAAIEKSVSEQLGVIASQQKELAEEQREEALREKQRADEAFQRSEVERQKALQAEHEARHEKEIADEQRQRAEEARLKAEAAEHEAREERNKADTLRYQALGRSLGSASRQAFSANQIETAQLLAYYAYHYTVSYGGEVYFPDVFQALLNASHSIRSWHKHRGVVRGVDFMPKGDDRLVTACDYGSILIHTRKTNGDRYELKTDTLFSNKDFDFRYAYADKQGMVYCVSRSGHLVVVNPDNRKSLRIIPVLTKDNPFAFWVGYDGHVMVLGEHQLADVDLSRSDDKAVVAVKDMGFTATKHSFNKGYMMVFDDHHREHLVKSINEIVTSEVPVPGTVTAFVCNKDMKAYGMEDGTIYLKKDGQANYVKLLGHESRVSQIKMSHNRIYSASYDGKVNFWYVDNEKIEPMELLSRQCWVLDFTQSNDYSHIWLGDKNGYLTEALLDASRMNSIIEQELRSSGRDLTEEEWNYYIGRTTPYRPLIVKDRKEAAR